MKWHTGVWQPPLLDGVSRRVKYGTLHVSQQGDQYATCRCPCVALKYSRDTYTWSEPPALRHHRLHLEDAFVPLDLVFVCILLCFELSILPPSKNVFYL
jgi:hypothetical protein